jgi:ribosomal subunit interface protein
MEIIVRGRNVVVPDHFRQHVAEKLERLERYDQKIIRVDVELQHEPNRRQLPTCERVEITCRTRGPAVRAEAGADDFYKALEQAAVRLERRFRRASDRRRVSYGRHAPVSVASATGALAEDAAGEAGDEAADTGPAGLAEAVWGEPGAEADAHAELNGALGNDGEDAVARIVRFKEHAAEPMTVDQALLEMELVGHDFYLFADAASGMPSVVYRRKGFDYGLIRLVASAVPVP